MANKKLITVTLDLEVYQRIQEIASKENRTLSNTVSTLLQKLLKMENDANAQ